MLVGIAALPAACLLASCATVGAISAQQTGCGQREIQISEDSGGGSPRTWVATCRGQRFRCFHVSNGESACAPEQMAPPPGTPMPGVGVRQVQGVASNGAPITLVVADLYAGGYHFHVAAAPSVDNTSARWTISAPVQQLGPACPASVMIDGIVNDFTVVSVRAIAGRAVYETTLPMVAVRAMAMGGRVSGRICDAEWRLDEQAATVIRDLVTRIDQQLSSAPPPTLGGQPPPPPGYGPVAPELR